MRNLGGLDELELSEAFRLPGLPAGTQRLIEGPENLALLAAVPRQNYTDLVLAFPLVNSAGGWNTNWTLMPSFPLFLRNVLVELAGAAEAPD